MDIHFQLILICVLLLFFAWPMVLVVCPNHEVLVFQPRTGNDPYLGSIVIFTNILDSSRPTCFNRFCISHFRPWKWFLSLPHIPPVDAAFLYCFNRFSPPPNSPGRGETVHLYGAPTLRLPPLFCASLPYWAATSSSLREPVSFIPCMVSPPLLSFTWSHFPVRPRFYPVRGSLPPSDCLWLPHICSPPCRPQPARLVCIVC